MITLTSYNSLIDVARRFIGVAVKREERAKMEPAADKKIVLNGESDYAVQHQSRRM